MTGTVTDSDALADSLFSKIVNDWFVNDIVKKSPLADLNRQQFQS